MCKNRCDWAGGLGHGGEGRVGRWAWEGGVFVGEGGDCRARGLTAGVWGTGEKAREKEGVAVGGGGRGDCGGCSVVMRS